MEIIPEMPYACERWTRNKSSLGEPLFLPIPPVLQCSILPCSWHESGATKNNVKLISCRNFERL